MMDIVERLRDVFSGNALKDIADQTQVYIKERYEAADEIERLRAALQQVADFELHSDYSNAPKDVEVIDGKVKAYDIGQNAIVNVRVKHDPTA